MTLIFGHRGAAGTYPENTMSSFIAAYHAGADGIELDVQMTKDGELVVIHDETVDRTTDGSGFVKEMLLSDILKLDASFTFSQFIGEARIPTLEEVLKWVATLPSFIINIELKNGIIEYPMIEERTIELVQKFNLEKRTIISSFNHYSLAKCAELSGEIDTAILYMEGLYKPWDYAKQVGASGLHPHLYAVNREIIENSKLHQVSVRPFTVNEEKVMINLMKNECTAFITDFPDRAVEQREKYKRKE
ncbi:glycerophosphodiester phosphodiesterase [Metabacillus niabensis]|uniref:glycerophosphodiester phosphodiesterase n=1 Tax=Metabacillus niabensis TaxID=324854 RepID=UPI001CFBD398|nr:glycerophosphodiester phosphodiesterase [Metabacillus niabensis]